MASGPDRPPSGLSLAAEAPGPARGVSLEAPSRRRDAALTPPASSRSAALLALWALLLLPGCPHPFSACEAHLSGSNSISSLRDSPPLSGVVCRSSLGHRSRVWGPASSGDWPRSQPCVSDEARGFKGGGRACFSPRPRQHPGGYHPPKRGCTSI